MARKRWHLILLGFVCGLCATAAFLWRTPPEYAARITIYVPASAGPAESFQHLATSDRIGQDVATRLGLAVPGEEIAGKLTATAGTALLTVTATDRSPAAARSIANATGTAFTGLLTDLERPAPGTAAVATVVAPATLPTSPVSPRLALDFALGALAGLAAGYGVALIRETLDRTVKSAGELVALTGAPNLGVAVHDPQLPRQPLTIRERPHSPSANAFRKLRASLQFVDVDSARKTLVVTSTGPDTGKTTLLCNLAVVLAAAGHRVVLVEADLCGPRAAAYLGLEGGVGVTTVLTGRVRLEWALQPWGGSVFDVLTAGAVPPNPGELLASARMHSLLDELRARYDMVLIDAPPLRPGSGATALGAAGDGVLLTVRYGNTTRRQVAAAVRALATVNVRLRGTILTMAPESAAGAVEDPHATTPLAAVPRRPVKTVNGHRRRRPAGAVSRNGSPR
ncbi:polysaccharide biosynthesis tyrosine autokinase [Amycolatopsis alkalitolerans]|uniref:polysaccharide biosynthesis tyrosine autokinase n=1 Tax=Amycolatopsis alkalitolerans TaxID=2547244 RepID=UPI00135B1EB9|nr:polysaccharide biosynthesis tyrosine autokinase [Amycolatopsis alkalitolerans]